MQERDDKFEAYAMMVCGLDVGRDDAGAYSHPTTRFAYYVWCEAWNSAS